MKLKVMENINKTKRFQKRIIFVLAVLLSITSLTGCGKQTSAKEYYTSVQQLHGKTVSSWVGSNIYLAINDIIPDAQNIALDTISDMMIALADGKIDGFGQADFRSEIIRSTVPNVAYLDDFSVDIDCAIAFSNTDKGSSLKSEFDEYIKSLEQSGELQKLCDEWVSDLTPHGLSTELNSWDGSKGTVTVGASAYSEPFCYQYSGNVSGYEMALVYGFCQTMHYKLELDEPNFAGMLLGISSGMYDIGIGGIEVTPERAQSINFSIPTYRYKGVIYVLTDPALVASDEELSLIDKIKDSINKNLILENRWKLVLRGVGTTLCITLTSAVCGSALGFILYLLCRKSRGILPKILNFLAWLIGGLPMVVMLMILYYIIFSKASISSVSVSIIGFTVSLMLSVYSLLSTAVKSIGKDQLEGAYSIGLTDSQAFFKVILPQALVQFIPNYQNILVSLIQGTAIVGYIAVEDITKVSDIIRARTYEAFFPLIITAILYLILGSLLTRIVKRIQINVDPRRRSNEKIMEKFKS